MIHALVLIDRGVNHVHRWKPSCSCAWVGVQRRRKQEAVKQYRTHVAIVGPSKRAAGYRPRPGKLTPVDQLPAALRCAT